MNFKFYRIVYSLVFIVSSMTYLSSQSLNSSCSEESTNSFFIENKGQIKDQNGKVNNNAKYTLNTPGLNVVIRNNGFSYDVYTKEKKKSSHIQEPHYLDTKRKVPSEDILYKFHRIDIDFLNTSRSLRIYGTEEVIHHYNYFDETSKYGITHVKSFKKIIYKNLYNHIDLEFFVPLDKEEPVEYNFIIHPKGKISDIKTQITAP